MYFDFYNGPFGPYEPRHHSKREIADAKNSMRTEGAAGFKKRKKKEKTAKASRKQNRKG